MATFLSIFREPDSIFLVWSLLEEVIDVTHTFQRVSRVFLCVFFCFLLFERRPRPMTLARSNGRAIRLALSLGR